MQNKTFIVAEAGINANSNLLTAFNMIDLACIAKVNAIKFQLWRSNRFPELEQYRFLFKQMAEIKEYAGLNNIKWFCTPFDFESIDFLAELGMDIWKVPSGMVTNRKYLEKIKSINPNQVFLSTGMADLDEIRTVLHILGWWQMEGPSNIIILHCTTAYPCMIEEVNLKAIYELIEYHGQENVGLSDHTLGIEIPIAAVALGASVIEKHFTLDRNMPGPDQKMSLEPEELKAMVKAIRNVELAMGDGIKRPTPSELKVRDEIRERMKL